MAPVTSTPMDESASVIRRVGLKVTAQRLAVLDALRDAPHSNADEVLAAVRADIPGISGQAVYGILAAFTGAGLARRITSAGSAARYECRVGDNHHHLVCVHCGDVRDVDCVVGEAPCLDPSDDAGFTILSAEVTFSGVCPDCARVSDSPLPSMPSTPTPTPTRKGSR